MNRKNFKAEVDFLLFSSPEFKKQLEKQSTAVDAELRKCFGSRVKEIIPVYLDEPDALPDQLRSILLDRSRGERFFAIEKNRSVLSRSLQYAGLYRSFPGYRFDSRKMQFSEITGSAMLQYIKKTPYLTADDLAAFRFSSGQDSNVPEFAGDYKELWDKYDDDRAAWKGLCSKLKDYADEHDKFTAFDLRKEKQKRAEEYTWIITPDCGRNVRYILQRLQEYGIAEKGSCVEVQSDNMLLVRVFDRYGDRSPYDKIFENRQALLGADLPQLYKDTNTHKVNLTYRNMEVSGYTLRWKSKKQDREARKDPKDSMLNRVRNLLQYFGDRGYLLHLNMDEWPKVSFTYDTGAVRDLLVTEGKILEIYTYYRAKKTGKFDDVVLSYNINWGETGSSNEFDCILTKGFCTLLVECKARRKLDQEFYYKLDSLHSQFGINTTAVLVADTQESGDIAKENSRQRQHWQDRVTTIWQPDEIKEIGHKLVSVMNGNYKMAIK